MNGLFAALIGQSRVPIGRNLAQHNAANKGSPPFGGGQGVTQAKQVTEVALGSTQSQLKDRGANAFLQSHYYWHPNNDAI